MGTVLNLWITLDNMDIFTILTLPFYEHRVSFHLFLSIFISVINVL